MTVKTGNSDDFRSFCHFFFRLLLGANFKGVLRCWIQFHAHVTIPTISRCGPQKIPSVTRYHSSRMTKGDFAREPGGTPLYGLSGTCRWTGYGFWPLCPEQGRHIILGETVLNTVVVKSGLS